MVGGIGLGNGGIFARSRPIEPAGVYDHAAQGRAVTADELGCGMDYNIRAMLDGPDEIGCAEGVIHHKRQAVPMGKRGKCVNIRDIAVGVAKRFNINCAGIVLDCRLDFTQIVDIDKGRGNPRNSAEYGQEGCSCHHKWFFVRRSGHRSALVPVGCR